MKEYPDDGKDFSIPSNIRQIGSIGSGARIYIEDYVHTYLNNYAASGAHCEKIAFLIGRHLVIDGMTYIFISGAIQGKYSEYAEGIETFTKKSLEYAGEEISRFFSGQEIVGFMQSQPGYGSFLNPFYAEYHMENFTKKTDLLFVLDPVERTAEFYRWNDDMTGLVEARGYFIYYDKNEGMNEYMLDNKPAAPKEKEPIKMEQATDTESKRKDSRELRSVRGEHSVTKRPVSRSVPGVGLTSQILLASLGLLFIVTLIMGAGLLQDRERIAKIEENMTVMSTAYNYLSNQVKMVSQPVFAQGEQSQEPQSSHVTDTNPSESIVAVNSAEPTLVVQETPSAVAIASPTPLTVSTPTPTAITETATPVTTPVTTPTATQSSSGGVLIVPETYTVEQGDSLIYISTKFYGTPDMVNAIMELNGFTDPDAIKYGKVIKLPEKK